MSFLFFIIGLCVGSFLNVIIDRLPQGRSIVRGRSACDFCHKNLSWYELIPLLSFFFLRGRCKNCHKTLPFQYPLVESITGIIFLFTFLSLSMSTSFEKMWVLLYLLFTFSFLLAIFVADLKYRIIPDQIVFALILVSFFFQLAFAQNTLGNHFLSGFISFLLFFLLFFITNGKGMGFGDVKFAFFMGLFLGFPKIIIAFYLAFLTGAFVSLILIVLGKKKMKSTVAFGPFLIFATVATLLFGSTLWMWLRKILGI